MPLVGRLVRGFNTARFTRTLSILTGSSVPVLEALRIAGEVVTNLPMREAVGDARSACAKARRSAARWAPSRLFPPMTIHLISSGESSGELETMLERAATRARNANSMAPDRPGGPAGPLLIVVHGPVRDGIVFAMLLPIFQMN